MKNLHTLFCIAAIMVLSVQELVFPARVAAITDMTRFMGQEAWAVDDECVAVGASAMMLAGDGNIEMILNFFMRKGLNLAQAAGPVGNFIQEAGGGTIDEKTGLQQPLPNIEQGGRIIPSGKDDPEYAMINGVGFGIAQWTFSARQDPLQKHVDGMGQRNTDLSAQLSFMWSELEGSYLTTLNDLRRTNDPVDAAIIFHRGYEGSNDSESEIIKNRGGNAQKIFDAYKNSSPLAGSEANENMNNPSGEDKVNEHGRSVAQKVSTTKSTSSSGGADGCKDAKFSGGNLNETLMAYAWPDYKTDNPTEKTLPYAAAVKKAVEQDMYVGADGIDCGAFVTLLIRDSGYDTGYNFGGKNGSAGDTSRQEEWLKQNWESIAPEDVTPDKLQPGDVAINSGHTFVYVADGRQNPTGFNAPIASASQDQRAPMADNQQSITDSSYNWYRKASPSGNISI